MSISISISMRSASCADDIVDCIARAISLGEESERFGGERGYREAGLEKRSIARY